jgi:hypothetical protein
LTNTGRAAPITARLFSRFAEVLDGRRKSRPKAARLTYALGLAAGRHLACELAQIEDFVGAAVRA